MTEEEAKKLGLFTKWKSVRCQSCDKYYGFRFLDQFGVLIVCLNCLEKLKKAEAERGQHPSLFDGRLF